ncbi:MAG: pyroglutamyl-peptidase I [Promethearchaeota archaeon]
MPTVLITGFEPFDGFTANPSEEIVKNISDTRINNTSVYGEVLPLDYKNAVDILDKAIEKYKPDYILCCGQANRAAISIERLAVNALSTKRPDNYENIPESDIINFEGPAAYFSNIDPFPLVQALLDKDIPAYVSYHAGLYGCNWILYKIMQQIEDGSLDVKATFIHLPPLPSQAIEKDTMQLATMSFDMQVDALKVIIENLSD